MKGIGKLSGKGKNLKKIIGYCTAVMCLVTTLVSAVPVSPVYAHAPQGSGDPPEVTLDPISIYNAGGELLEISLEDVGEASGGICICTSTSFRVISAAIDTLYDEDEIPSQGELTAVYRHPGSGHKAAFAYILTEAAAVYEKTGNPQQLTLDNWVYTFTRQDTGEVFETSVRDGVIAENFFELRYAVNGFKNGWHETEPTAEQKAEFLAAWEAARDNFLTLPAWELYTGIEEPEEPLPVWSLIFTGLILVAMVFGFVQSYRSKKRG